MAAPQPFAVPGSQGAGFGGIALQAYASQPGTVNAVSASATPAAPWPASSPPAQSTPVGAEQSVTLLYGGEGYTFGWRKGIPPRDFAQQLGEAVRTITRLATLDGVVMQLEPSNPGMQPQSLKPRDLYEGHVVGLRIQLVVPSNSTANAHAMPSPAVSAAIATMGSPVNPGPEAFRGGPMNGTPASKPISQRNLLEVPGRSIAGREQPGPKREKAAPRFQKQGGSQLQFLQMMAANNNPKGVLEDGVQLTAAEVAKHKTAGDCWTIYQGKVYNCTPYMDFHPGGKKNLMAGAGKDCTAMYNKVHPWVSIDGLLGKLCLGPVVKPPPEEQQDEQEPC